MRFLITITTAAGTLNIWADRENDARIATGLLVASQAITRLQIFETNASGQITRNVMDETL